MFVFLRVRVGVNGGDGNPRPAITVHNQIWNTALCLPIKTGVLYEHFVRLLNKSRLCDAVQWEFSHRKTNVYDQQIGKIRFKKHINFVFYYYYYYCVLSLKRCRYVPRRVTTCQNSDELEYNHTFDTTISVCLKFEFKTWPRGKMYFNWPLTKRPLGQTAMTIGAAETYPGGRTGGGPEQRPRESCVVTTAVPHVTANGGAVAQ